MFPCQQMPYLNNIAYCNDTPTIIGLTSNVYQLEAPLSSIVEPVLSTTLEYEDYAYGTVVEEYKTEVKSNNTNEVEYYDEPETTTKKPKPSITAAKNFDAKKDAERLAKAMTELGTDEETIVRVLSKRTFKQRTEIAKAYKSWLGMNLIEDLSKEVSGKLKFLILALMTPLPQLYALELRNAMRGVGTNEDVLIEILSTLSNEEMKEVKKAYFKLFETELEKDIHGDTSGHFRKLLLTLCVAKRSDDTTVNPLRAKHLAKKLLRAGEQRTGNDPAVFTWILTSQAPAQLSEIFRQYTALAGHTINDAIYAEFRGVMRNAYDAIAKVILNKSMFFAECLYKSMKGFGTNDKQLVRIIVSRSEVDLGDIADTFYKMFSMRLDTWIEMSAFGKRNHPDWRSNRLMYGRAVSESPSVWDDCSGLYKKCLLSILGIPDHTLSLD